MLMTLPGAISLSSPCRNPRRGFS